MVHGSPYETLDDTLPGENGTAGAMPPVAPSIVGIAWYRAEDYPRLATLMADGASFPKSHASWRQKATRMERELRRQGVTPVRVEVDLDAFERRCTEQGVARDSEARNRFVEEVRARQAVSSA